MVQLWQAAGTALSGCCQGVFVHRYSPTDSRGGHTSSVPALPTDQTVGTHLAQRASRGAQSHCPGGAEARQPCTEPWGTTQTHDHPADQQMQSGWHRHGLCSHHSSAGTKSSQEDGGGGHMSCCWAGAGLPSSLLPPGRPEETCCPEVCPPASITGTKETW